MKGTSITIRISEKTKALLQEVARNETRSLSGQAFHFIQNGLLSRQKTSSDIEGQNQDESQRTGLIPGE